MSDVNHELRASRTVSSQQRVADLFGTAPAVLLKAVGRFLKKEPGPLDHHNLRIIAAAARQIDDPQIVAEMVEQLPITKMHIAARPIDKEAASRQFEVVLAPYDVRTKRRLVDDLVSRTMLRFLMFSPPERLPPEAKSVVEHHLLELTRSPATQEKAVASPHATPLVIETVLEAVEARIARVEGGTETRQPGKMPLSVVKGPLLAVLDHSDATSAPHVARAWQLVERCEPDDAEVFKQAVIRATQNTKLDLTTATAVLDAIERVVVKDGYIDPRSAIRSSMISNPNTPETVVREAIRRGFKTSTFKTSITVDTRWLAIRLNHYATNSNLMEDLGPAEIDAMVAALPAESIDRSSVAAMKDPDALRRLSTRALQLDPAAVYGLIHNPNTPAEVTFGDIPTPPDTEDGELDWSSSREMIGRAVNLVSDPRLSDEDLTAALKKYPSHEDYEDVFKFAVGNRSAGPKLLDHLLTRTALPHDLIEDFAKAAVSPEIHERFAQMARSGSAIVNGQNISDVLHEAVVRNATVGPDVIGEIPPDDASRESSSDQQLFMHRVSPMDHRIDYGYVHFMGTEQHRPTTVARRLIDGTVPRDRVDHIVALAKREVPNNALQKEYLRAASILADADQFGDKHWKALTASDDLHTAMRFASHPNCPMESSAVQPIAVELLGSTAQAVTDGLALPKAGGLRSWDQLPNMDNKPFRSSPAAELIHRRVVEGSRLEVIDTPGRLRELAEEMGNCLQGYETSAETGRTLVAVARGEEELTAMAWKVDLVANRTSLKLLEMNTKFNRDRVRPELKRGVEEMTAKINNGEITTPVPADRTSVRRAPLRAERLALEVRSAAEPLARPMDEPPSLLTPHEPAAERRTDASSLQPDNTPTIEHQGSTETGLEI